MDKNIILPWHIVEKKIHDEIDWLKKVIDIDTRGITNRLSNFEEMGVLDNNYFFYRSLAILIVSGQVRAREINSQYLWGKDILNKNTHHRHGKDWHANMMSVIEDYFKYNNYETTTEPHLYKGRADLGIFKKDKKDLYIEVGTTSIDKLCVNLNFMRECLFLLIPIDNTIIEFEIL